MTGREDQYQAGGPEVPDLPAGELVDWESQKQRVINGF